MPKPIFTRRDVARFITDAQLAELNALAAKDLTSAGLTLDEDQARKDGRWKEWALVVDTVVCDWQNRS